MDVIALRKVSGTTTGEIRMNGFVQERISFLRSSGYVEQFDVQQAELTVRETVTFSARLRLDSSKPLTKTDKGKRQFVDYVLDTMALTPIENFQVGKYGNRKFILGLHGWAAFLGPPLTSSLYFTLVHPGNYTEGGLTFEQRKRLAIAVELAASPSVIFLDEVSSPIVMAQFFYLCTIYI